MLPTRERIADLQARFNVSNGRVLDPNRYKNLNWYIRKGPVNRVEPGEWFCYGDVNNADIIVLSQKLRDGEVIIMGWKDMPKNVFLDEFSRDGGGVRLVITKAGVVYDSIRDGRVSN